jgi:predicted enzyme related to lactoylglutathione lyase
VASHPDLVKRRTVQPVNTSIGRASTTELREVLVRGLLTVAGVDDAQWAAVRTAPADGGEVIHAPRSVGDVHAIKALSWAVWAVQSERNHLGLVL